MCYFQSMLTETVQEWSPALGVLAGVIVAAALLRAGLRSLKSTSRWAEGIRHLAPSIARLLYIVGAQLFVEVAPLNPKVERWLDSAIYVLAVLLVLGLIRRVTLFALEFGASPKHGSRTLQLGFVPMIRNLITIFVLLTGVIMILKHFNYDVMSLIAALGVGSLAVGLAAQPTLSNMISGFTLIIDRNLRPGDKVNMGGVIGDVDEIGLRSTRIRTGDGNMLIVPNAEMVNTKILNLSVPAPETTCSTVIRVPGTVPFARVREVGLKLAADVSVAVRSRTPTVLLTSLADGHQLITISLWVQDTGATSAAVSELNEKLIEALAAAQIPLLGPVARA